MVWRNFYVRGWKKPHWKSITRKRMVAWSIHFRGGWLLEIKSKKRKSVLTLLVEMEKVRVFSLEVTLERVCWPCKWKCKKGWVLADESIYRQSLPCRPQKRRTKIEVVDVVMSTNHEVFLANVPETYLFTDVRHLCFGNKWHNGHFKIYECKSYNLSVFINGKLRFISV